MKDASCVEVCPVDCISPGPDTEEYDATQQLYINPVECIDCGACEPACPVGAIFEASRIPPEWASSVETNAAYFSNLAQS
jgi:NAD-dependent dihydropyrimidine dehydrogenase PreA subunit